MGSMDPRPTAVIVAVDGTLLDDSAIRHLLAGHHPAYTSPAADEYVALSLLAPPDPRMLQLVLLEQALGHKVFILTSRPDRYRAGLEIWLARQGLDTDGILMRAEGEDRPDADLKTAMAAAVMAEHDIVHAYDDRADVVYAYAHLGLEATRCVPAAHSPLTAPATTGR